ncbi:MAG: acyl--CoA ligase [bacterium]|nr:acyl--CoA ligase [bacterium]
MNKERNFAALLREQFKNNSQAPAIVLENETRTYGQLETRVEAVGLFLKEQGVKKGDVVILYTPDKASFLLLHLGIILYGGISLPLNFKFTAHEMTYFINDSGARLVFASGQQAALVNAIKHQCPDLQTVIDPAIVSRLKLHPEPALPAADIRPDDGCFIIYSSGTTGQPKGVVHTHGNVAASLLALQRCWKFTPGDVLLNVLPLFHVHGLSFGVHLSLITGSAVIIQERFDAVKTMDKIREATVFMAVPTIHYEFLERPEFKEKAKEWTNTRLFTCGSAPIRPQVLEEIQAIIGKSLINRYGMTESHVITSLPLDGPFKHGSVGLPIDGIEMIIRPEPGNEESGVGEVAIRGPNLFHRYWNKPEATVSAFNEEGFFNTGDLGYLDEDGYLFLVGRKKDLIITSGYNVYPPVVERVINGFPGVKESAVIGIPDDRKGETVMALIVPDASTSSGDRLNMEALNDYCRQKLVHYQRPSIIEIIPQLPRNTMGKILKRELKEMFP